MKKIWRTKTPRRTWLIILIVLLTGAGYFYAKLHKKTAVNNYSSVLTISATSPTTTINQESLPTLNTMLAAGIQTFAGIVSVAKVRDALALQYIVTVNGKPSTISAASPIALVKAFLINNKQIMIFSFDQGGNQCSIQYQLMTISQNTPVLVSKVFGSCLPLTNIIESKDDSLVFIFPQNNPYLGTDIVISYKYLNGQINEASPPNHDQVKHKFAGLTPTQILHIAQQDGCYIDGVLLDDNACAGGQKYCVMFKNLVSPPQNQDYRILQDFCTQP